jgi:Zn-dependent protease
MLARAFRLPRGTRPIRLFGHVAHVRVGILIPLLLAGLIMRRPSPSSAFIVGFTVLLALLGHIAAASAVGIRVSVDAHALGVCVRMPEQTAARRVVVILAAGPLANVVGAGVLMGVYRPISQSASAFLHELVLANLVWALVNVPACPGELEREEWAAPMLERDPLCGFQKCPYVGSIEKRIALC